MSKQKKGFTLIELMVVIVIIGILAAIAIPKLFGMSAKAKAQEVGGVASTWVKMQQAYEMERGRFGTNKEISFKLPAPIADDGSSTTSNFIYVTDPPDTEVLADDAVVAPSFKATSRFSTDDCATAQDWTVDILTTGIVAKMPANCESLTPNFCGIGDNTKANCLGGT